MGTLTLAAVKGAFADYDHANTNDHSSSSVALAQQDYLFIGFDQSTLSSITGKAITRAEIRLTGLQKDWSEYPVVYRVVENWDQTTLTYNNRPATATSSGRIESSEFLKSEEYEFPFTTSSRFDIEDLIKYGFRADGWNFSQAYTAQGGAKAPALILTYSNDAPARYLEVNGPKSGYIPKNTTRRFTWGTGLSKYCVGADSVTYTCVFRWKPEGGSATDVNVGSATYYDLAGTSITADSIQWQVEVTDSLGNDATSEWYTLTTVDATSTAKALSPVNVMVDGGSDNVFRWSHSISTGTAPTRSVVKVSADSGSTWTTVIDQSNANTYGTVTAGTLPSGDLLWSVRTYNADSVAGTWSPSVNITVVAPSAAPVVSSEQTPRPTVSWQSSGQQGWQLRVKSLEDAIVYDSGSMYGTETSYKLPLILADGSYTVEVRVVNEYGLWSDWGTAPCVVSNIAGDAIVLTATASGSIALTWTTTGTYERYMIERDGEPVAVTTETAWLDRAAVGSHSYRILGIQAGSDDYGISNTETVELTVRTNSITDLETGEMLGLPYSTAQIREEQIGISRQMALTHFGASAWPTAELGKAKDKTISLEAAFDDLEDCRRLEAMIGHLVCVKAKNDEAVTGVLPGLTKISSAFWVAYEMEIAQTDDGEEVTL